MEKGERHREPEKKLVDIYELISIGMMVAFGNYQNSEVTDSSLRNAIKILKKEEKQRKKYSSSKATKKRISMLTCYRDKYASEIPGRYVELPDGTSCLEHPSKRTNFSGKELMQAIYRSSTYAYALLPSDTINLIKRELQQRSFADLKIDNFEPFGISKPIPSNYGNIQDDEYGELLNGQGHDKKNGNNEGLGK